MTRALALAALLCLAACHRHEAETAPDADADARNATAAKTLADLQAAEDAAKAPLPRPAAVPVAVRAAETMPDADEPADTDNADNATAPTDPPPR